MKSFLKPRLKTFISCMLILVFASACAPNNKTEVSKAVDRNRENYIKQAEDLRGKYEQNPGDISAAFEYSKKLFQLGDFSKSQEVIKQSHSENKPYAQALCLLAQLEYLNGNYAEAERLNSVVLEQFPAFRENAEYGLGYVYYQTNQYAKSHNLSASSDLGSGIIAMMQAFDSADPYRLEWVESERVVIPFLAAEPLPVIQAEIKGKLYNFLIDTGAGDTFIDEKLVEELEIKTIEMSGIEGTFAGGATAEIKYGILDSIAFDGVKINKVPIILHSSNIMKALSATHKKNDITLDGIIGVGIFKQFLTTMDYPGNQLILCPRGIENTVTSSGSTEVPFVMGATHLLISKGEINGKQVTVLVDSGLAIDEKAILLPKETVKYTDINITKKRFGLGTTGAGLGIVRMHHFDLDRFALGSMPIREKISGLSGIFPESLYFEEEIGFFIDSLISHNYLKNYRWTIDFDSMKMIFD